MDNNGAKQSARFPESYYYGIRPISSIVAEMDDMSVAYPTPGIYDAILGRVHDQVVKMYPYYCLNKIQKSQSHKKINNS